jgi:hypothetical protein
MQDHSDTFVVYHPNEIAEHPHQASGTVNALSRVGGLRVTLKLRVWIL